LKRPFSTADIAASTALSELGCVVDSPPSPQATDIPTTMVSAIILTCPSMFITSGYPYAIVALRTRIETISHMIGIQ
jgi:hypothetical protein